MRIVRWVCVVTLLVLDAGLTAQTATRPATHSEALSAAANVGETELLDASREAGLLTEWHLDGRFGHGKRKDFARRFTPEREAMKQATRSGPETQYELIFPDGKFSLPKNLASQKGVFYASSRTYLDNDGDWILYLESGGEAEVFVDGQLVLTRDLNASGVLRAKFHANSGYHSVMVKFTARAAPFRVAILPPNSGSRRKNNTPYVQGSASDEMLAALRGIS
ncbi:MAG: hypothetical protein CXZ00_06585 [Acidobacteria bacterium]|nr:MAG: hypothetical protein CXZ00_06585 [Acidobacteriota bacterium]